MNYIKKNNLVEMYKNSVDKEDFSSFAEWFYFWYVDSSWRHEPAKFTQEEYEDDKREIEKL
jgi:hypothetical protein